MKIIQDFIPKGRNNRPQIYMNPTYIATHDTGNTNPYADAEVHSGYVQSNTAANLPVSWHFTVDDTDTIYQHLPINEIGYHTGNRTGNYESIGIEICMNQGANRQKAEKNAIWLTNKLMKDKSIPIENVKQHFDFNGKNCPQVIRSRHNGWKLFLEEVVRSGNMKEVKTAEEAIQWLVDNKVILDGTYWIHASKIIKYFEDFLVKIVNYMINK